MQNDPLTELYYKQVVDHNHPHKSGTFHQRYYENLHYWEGPGHPLFVILGGEGPLKHILYPYISLAVAKAFGGVTLNPEHRYYGKSFPVKNPSDHDLRKQLTPRQAMEDFVQFIKGMQEKLGCGPKGSPTYCPVVTIGGSYPGLLSVLLRINYSDTVDIGYGAGVPFHTWDNSAPVESAYEYYDFITYIADRDSPGCADGVKGTLMSLIHEMKALDEDPNSQVQLSEIAKEFGVCPKTIPSYIKTAESLAQKFAVKAAGRYSNTNMDYYPPGPDTLFIQDCKEFQNATATPRERMRNFLIGAAKTDQESDCYDLGGGKNPAKDDDSGRMWDILCCYLAPVMGQSEKSMFPYQEFDPEGDIKDCKKEFGITMDPSHMVRDFKFSYDYLKKQSNILLTNGLNDGWGALSYHEDLSDKVVVLNFENGAHHSELLHIWTPEDNQDTPDILQGHDDIIAILGQWLDEIKAKKAHV